MPTVLMLVTNPLDPDPRVEREAKALVDAGLQVRIAALSFSSRTIERVKDNRGFEIVRLPNPQRISSLFRRGWKITLLNLLRYYFEILKRASLLMKDVTVVHSHDFDTLPIGYVLSKLGAKLVYDSHEAFSGMFSKSVPRMILLLVDALESALAKRAKVLTVGRLLANRFQKMTGTTPVIVRNTPSELPKRQMPVQNERFVVGYVGGLLEDRCLIEIINGFEIFWKSHPDSELRIAGFGPMQDYIEQRILHSQANITFFGKLPYDEVFRFLSTLDLSLILFSKQSLNNYYASPNKLFESSLMGIPVLASNFGELGWLVSEYKLGYVVKPDDSEEITKALSSIYATRAELGIMGDNALNVALKHFSWETAKNALYKVYNELLELEVDLFSGA